MAGITGPVSHERPSRQMGDSSDFGGLFDVCYPTIKFKSSTRTTLFGAGGVCTTVAMGEVVVDKWDFS